jgi:hypothetical protein
MARQFSFPSLFKIASKQVTKHFYSRQEAKTILHSILNNHPREEEALAHLNLYDNYDREFKNLVRLWTLDRILYEQNNLPSTPDKLYQCFLTIRAEKRLYTFRIDRTDPVVFLRGFCITVNNQFWDSPGDFFCELIKKK